MCITNVNNQRTDYLTNMAPIDAGCKSGDEEEGQRHPFVVPSDSPPRLRRRSAALPALLNRHSVEVASSLCSAAASGGAGDGVAFLSVTPSGASATASSSALVVKQPPSKWRVNSLGPTVLLDDLPADAPTAPAAVLPPPTR